MNYGTCKNFHPLLKTPGINRNFPSCNLCGQEKLSTSYCCYQCTLDLCLNCSSNSIKFSEISVGNPNFQNNFNVGTNYQGTSNIINLNHQGNIYVPNINYNVGTTYLPNTNYPQGNIYVPTTNFNQGHNFVPNLNYNQSPNFNTYQDIPNSNFLNSSTNMINYPNSSQTKIVKFCNKKHKLLYTDSNQRNNVVCNNCGKTKINHQFTCTICDYDECQTCYNERPSLNIYN